MAEKPTGTKCQHENCKKFAQSSVDGHHVYCIAHMKLYGQQPIQLRCKHEGCTKWPLRGSDGEWKFCR